MDGGKDMRVEILFPPEGTFCTFEPAFNVPYLLVHAVEVPAQALGEALDWTWRYANAVHQRDPWTRTGLRWVTPYASMNSCACSPSAARISSGVQTKNLPSTPSESAS